jgi:predicted RecB family nuclease
MNGARIGRWFAPFPGCSTYSGTMETLDQVPEGDRLTVSATLYVTYRRCPQQALARVQGIYAAPTRASFKGALMHRLIARHLSSGPIDDGDLALVCRQETGANLNAQLGGVGLKPSEFDAVVHEVGELYRRFAALPMDGVADPEVAFEDEMSEGVILRGRIDAVFTDADGARIVDWKTGTDLGDDVASQLAFYAMAWERSSGDLPATTEAMSLVSGERLTTHPTTEDVASTAAAVEEMVRVLREARRTGQDLDRTAGPHCRWCPLLEDCAEGLAARGILD